MDESQLAYRIRTAEPGDEATLRAAIGVTLDHPDQQSRRASYRGAASRGDLLVLERFDRQQRTWLVAAFVESHLRVDDSLSIRDVGTAGDELQPAAARYLLDDLLQTARPVGATVKIRRDAIAWRDLFESIPGFEMDGEEYRRPHYWAIWLWDPARARQAQAGERSAAPAPPRPPRPPAPSRGPVDDRRRTGSMPADGQAPDPRRDGRRPQDPRPGVSRPLGPRPAQGRPSQPNGDRQPPDPSGRRPQGRPNRRPGGRSPRQGPR